MLKNTETDTQQETQETENEGVFSVDDETIANMTDEEFAEYLKTQEDSVLKDTDEEEITTDATVNTDTVNTSNQSNKEEEEEESTDTEETGTDSENAEKGSENTENKDTKDTDTSNDSTTVDYEAVYKQIFKPFKANGKEIVPESPEEIVKLMQMGANYTKKMSTIKPHIKVIKTLENANISEDDLNLLVDLHKGNPEAIKALMQKHNLQSMDVDRDEDFTYVPNKNVVTDEDVDFSSIVSEIKESGHYDAVYAVATETWDKASRDKILAEPRLLKALHEEFLMGRFDTIQEAVERDRIFGKYHNMSDLDAYIAKAKEVEAQKTTNKTVVVKENTVPKSVNKTVVDPSINKKGASIPNKKPNTRQKLSDEELGKLSDEEYLKLFESGKYS